MSSIETYVDDHAIFLILIKSQTISMHERNETKMINDLCLQINISFAKCFAVFLMFYHGTVTLTKIIAILNSSLF